MSFQHHNRYWIQLLRCFSILSIILVAVAANFFSKPQLPKNYQTLSASDKQTKLWNIIKSKEGTQSSYPTIVGSLLTLTESFAPTVEHYGDNVPYNHKKRIHSVGAVAQTKFVITNTENNPFTGIFQTGSMYGLSRLSLAATVTDNTFIPGIAVKFLRSNSKPSANFVAMISLEGQIGGNFFRNEFSNHIPRLSEDASFFLKLGLQGFKRVSNDPFKVGLSDIGSYFENGTAIEPKSSVNFPFKLILVPNPSLTSLFRSIRSQQELKARFTNKLLSNTTLYQIYGTQSPTNSTRILIGELVTTSETIYSELGDEFLFYRHQLMEEDIKLRPEWKSSNRRVQEQTSYDKKNIRRSRQLQNLLDDMTHNTHLAAMHSNVSRFSSLCAFAQLV